MTARVRGDERAGHAGCLAERPHVDDPLATRSPKCASVPRPSPSTPKPCASSTTSHASYASASASRSRQRRDVAVHAEHRVGDDELARRPPPPSSRASSASTSQCAIADERRARQQRAVVQARVVEAVGEDDVVAAGERGEDREVREIAARERQRARAGARRDERGELVFERRVRRRVADDQVRRAGAHAPARDRVARGVDDRRRRWRGPGSRCWRTRAPTGRRATARGPAPIRRSAACAQGRRRDDGELALECCNRRRAAFHDVSAGSASVRRVDGSRRHAARACRPRDHAGASPSLSNSARSASTSGLPVVSSRSP